LHNASDLLQNGNMGKACYW